MLTHVRGTNRHKRRAKVSPESLEFSPTPQVQNPFDSTALLDTKDNRLGRRGREKVKYRWFKRNKSL